ncbi:MAG: hypothetical protein J3K34DRAFT_400425 [Monoraphidium minutum]|nr:MAG: hypothetical protein J3K34DRAFT_400425 [Monoraphidium minutum]
MRSRNASASRSAAVQTQLDHDHGPFLSAPSPALITGADREAGGPVPSRYTKPVPTASSTSLTPFTPFQASPLALPRPKAATMLAQKNAVRVQAPKAQSKAAVNIARAAAAVVTSVVMLASPVMAADVKETVRPAVCAGNPTAKICLQGSYDRSK